MRLATALLALFLPALALAQTLQVPDLREAPGKLITPARYDLGGDWISPLINDFGLEISMPVGLDITRGRFGNDLAVVHKFGRNDDVASATWERVDLLSDSGATYPSAGTTIRIKAGGNAADDAGAAGCRLVRVEGLRSDTLARSIVYLTPDGANASDASTTAAGTFLRVYRATCHDSGTYGAANTGDIIIENSAGTLDLLKMAAGEGQTQFAGYTVPDGYAAYLIALHLTVDNAQNADFRFFAREDADDATAPVKPPRIKLYFDGVANSFVYRPGIPEGPYTGGTDLWVEARGGAGAAAEVTANMTLLIVAGD